MIAMKQLCLATGNKNKLIEIKMLYSDLNINWKILSDFPDIPVIVEDQDSFEGNALKKASEIFRFTKLTTIADDSGLEVDFLNGDPGIHSARFSGEIKNDKANNKKLLSLLKDVPFEQRTARFRCAAALTGDDFTKVVTGKIEGHIILSPRGESGFGYDPIFIPNGYDKTFAELGPDIKNQISHRARAFIALKQFLLEYI